MDPKEMQAKLENEMEIMSTPINFKQFEEQGFIKKIGKSYYTNCLHDLPELLSKKVKSINSTKNGMRLTFYK